MIINLNNRHHHHHMD